MDTIKTRIAELRSEMGELAAEGDITGCDIRHGQIATLEQAMEIIEAGS